VILAFDDGDELTLHPDWPDVILAPIALARRNAPPRIRGQWLVVRVRTSSRSPNRSRRVTTETPRSLLPGVVGVRDEVRVAA